MTQTYGLFGLGASFARRRSQFLARGSGNGDCALRSTARAHSPAAPMMQSLPQRPAVPDAEMGHWLIPMSAAGPALAQAQKRVRRLEAELETLRARPMRGALRATPPRLPSSLRRSLVCRRCAVESKQRACTCERGGAK